MLLGYNWNCCAHDISYKQLEKSFNLMFHTDEAHGMCLFPIYFTLSCDILCSKHMPNVPESQTVSDAS